MARWRGSSTEPDARHPFGNESPGGVAPAQLVTVQGPVAEQLLAVERLLLAPVMGERLQQAPGAVCCRRTRRSGWQPVLVLLQVL